MDHNPIWENIHKGLIKSVGTRESVADLIDKHIHLLFTQTKFTLDKAMERFMLYFWCEYLFGSEVNPDDFIKTRDKLLSAMRYSFYNNSFKNMPILGELTCRFYGWLKGDEFNDVDDELREFISQSSGGLISRLRQQLLASDSFPKELVNQAVLDNAFDLVIVFDFINNAMYESMAEIIKHKINNDEKRRDSYATGLRNAFMFPYRVRVPQQDIQLNDRAIQHGSYVFVNLLKSGVYHSSGPRACVGRGVASWIKDRFFDQLKDIEFNIDSISMPQDRMTPPHADVPKSPERYEVSWRYPRDYLQQHLPSYPFKNIDHFYDVLNAFENPRLFGFVVASWVDEIKKLNIKHDNLVIVAPEMRGIPLAAAIARELDVPQVFIRKPGKIPGSVFSKTYTNAYAEETLEMSEHAALKGKQVILIDDGIASGGTTVTCCKLIEDAGGCVAGIYGMINHLYKDKIDDLHEYDNRVHTLFDFVA
jgi:adenine phosphoribosyltransferase